MKKSLIFVVIIFVVFVIIGNLKSYKNYSFEELCIEWQKYPNKRVDISQHLVKREYLIGMNKEKIFKLLGKPSKEIKKDSLVIYSCTKKRLILGYTLFLEIQFNKNNKAIKVRKYVIDD